MMSVVVNYAKITAISVSSIDDELIDKLIYLQRKFDGISFCELNKQ